MQNSYLRLMHYKSLKHFVNILERNGELIRISEYVNPYLEITEIVDRISKSSDNNKALLFENTGTNFPLLINALGSYNRICMALRTADLDDIASQIEDIFQRLTTPKPRLLDKLLMLPQLSQMSNWMPRVVRRRGLCQQVVMANPDIRQLPVLTCWPRDGGPFLTLPLIHTIHPETKMRNMGIYRMQVFDAVTTGMHWHKHKVSAMHFQAYKNCRRRMPVAVALGGDPVYTYAATAPLPENVDEYILAGFLRKKRVTLVPCITQPEMAVPEDADIIIEGYIDPEEALKLEGPFGDHTGFYSLPDLYPAFHITAITHCNEAIYPATIVGVPPQEDAWIGKATERIFISPIKMTLIPELIDMHMPVEGVFHNLVIAQMKKDFAGQALKLMNAMWGAGQMMFNKILVVIDERASCYDYEKLLQSALKHFNALTDMHVSQGPMDVLDHSCSKMGFGGKICFDFTRKHVEEQQAYQLVDKVALTHKNLKTLQDLDKSIMHINMTLLEKNIPVIAIAVKKNKTSHIAKLHQKVAQSGLINGIKIILYVNDFVTFDDWSLLLWWGCNNIDPKRDIIMYHSALDQDGRTRFICAGFDATIKRKGLDHFERDWPNVIMSDDNTIKAIDEKWGALGLGTFISSPSLQFKGLDFGNDAHLPSFQGKAKQGKK